MSRVFNNDNGHDDSDRPSVGAGSDLELRAVAIGRADLTHAIRRLNVFSRTVDVGLDQFNRRYDRELALSRKALTRAFLEWVRGFDVQRELADRDRRDFSHFAAGLLLRSFVRHHPVTESRAPSNRLGRQGPEDAIVSYWPEGFFYFEFCITVLDKVLAEQNLSNIEIAPNALELRSWQSFRENVVANPDLAVPFLDLFLSGDPVWDFPTAARFRAALHRTLIDEHA